MAPKYHNRSPYIREAFKNNFPSKFFMEYLITNKETKCSHDLFFNIIP